MDIGVILKASADSPSDDSVIQESRVFDEVSNLHYSNEFLFFIATDYGQNSTSTSAVYYKNVPKTGEVTSVVNKVIDGFQNLVSVAVFDEFIYIADSTQGIFAIEAYTNGTFSERRTITLNTGDILHPEAPKPTTMVTFTLGGL